MKLNRKLSENLFRIFALTICWFTLIFDFIMATSHLLGKSEFKLFTPLEYLSFMTIWTNLLIALVFTLPLILKKQKITQFLMKPFVLSAIVIYIQQVGITYHFMLADTWNPTGLRKLTDLLMHYFIPIIYIAYWVIFVEKGEIKFKSIYKWLLYPLIYAVFIIIRGAVVKKYPYPFVDVNELGYNAVLITLAVFLLFYYVLGILVWVADMMINKSRPAN